MDNGKNKIENWIPSWFNLGISGKEYFPLQKDFLGTESDTIQNFLLTYNIKDAFF